MAIVVIQDGVSEQRSMKADESTSKKSLTSKELFVSNNVTVERSEDMATTKKYIIYALGIFVSYFYFGILQEKITRSKYGDEGEVFTFSTSLVFVMCVVNTIFAKIMLKTFMKQGKDETNIKYYAICAVSYLGAMVASFMALRHVNYPTQVVGKSCKPIATMILGVVIGRKRYPLSKYIFVILIVLGICLFMYKDKKSLSTSNENALGMGELLLLISLALDGVTGGVQERMKTEHQTKSGHMMYNINIWACFYLLPTILFTGEFSNFILFVQKYPELLHNVAIVSLLSALGQMFIYLTVSEFGPLPCSIVTTTRKFFTVFGSVIIFGNSLTVRQWLGTLIVFMGLSLDSFYGKRNDRKKN